MFYPNVVKCFDALGEEIPSLSGPYTRDLRDRINASADDRTKWMDATPDTLREEYGHLTKAPAEHRWKAQEENTIGGWCITIEDIPGTPADGNPPIGAFMTEDVAARVVALHNETLDGEDVRAPEMGERA